MRGQDRVRHQQWMLIEWDRVPRSSAILLAILAHFLVASLIFLSWSAGKVRILPQEYKSAQTISGAAQLAYNSKSPQPYAGPAHIRRKMRPMRVPENGSAAQVAAAQTLRTQAKQATAAITMSLRFRQIYGFSPNYDYQLAVQTRGEIPPIPADEVPPHFQQYVIVEVTIDIDGRVAEARIVAGLVP